MVFGEEGYVMVRLNVLLADAYKGDAERLMLYLHSKTHGYR